MKFRYCTAMTVAALLTEGVAAQGFFLPANDLRLREDLTLLVDQGVINLPVNEWPLARLDVADADSWRIREVRASAGEPALLRDYATPGRENGELTSIGGATTDRYSITLAATGVLDASDVVHAR